MSTDYQVLIEKFHNFKEYVKSICNNQQVLADYSKMTDNEFLLFGLGFLIPNKNKVPLIVKHVCSKMKVTDEEAQKKVAKYMECFIEYLDQLNHPEIMKTVIKDCADEQGIKIN